MDQKLFEDIMNQTYNEDICYNPSKLLLVRFISENVCRTLLYKKREFQEYLYRIYIDNPTIAKKHPSYIVRNIEKYGVSDLVDLVEDTLESWCRDAKNSIIIVGQSNFAVQVQAEDAEDIAKNLTRLSMMLYRKVYGESIPGIRKDIPEDDDHDINIFGKGIFRNRVLEDMQYCPICEDINTQNLVAVHIVENCMGTSQEDKANKANGLIFCRKHAIDYIERKFEFNELGFVCNISSEDIEEGMHLSFAIRSSERKEYLKRRIEYKT